MQNKNDHPIDIYIPKKSYEILMEKFAAIDYFVNVQKAGTLHLVDDGDSFQIGDIKISVVGYKGKGSDTCAYLIEHKGKKAIYSPCDTISFEQHKKFNDLDLLITECGAFSYVPDEISFKDMINRCREIKPKKTIITHIEEIELNTWGEKHFESMKKEYPDVKFDYAYDGMKIKL